MVNTINYPDYAVYLRDTGYPPEPAQVFIHVPDAENLLRQGLAHFTGGHAVWDEQNYRPIVNWLTDNHGRGLLLMGENGLGKTLIGLRILPVLIHYAHKKVVRCFRAQEMCSTPDIVLASHISYIDDVGTESISNVFGNRRVPFAELCDIAEIRGKLLIISTNCDIPHLREKYGDRTVDRLRAITTPVLFTGKSHRI
jgi:DNA replication protein DnaC